MWYNYDGLGKRRNKLFADPDDLHWYRWAGWSVLSEYDTTGASGWEIPAAAARVDVAGLAERGAGAAYAYRLHDHLGSVRGLRGASKAPLARYAYAPYGELNHGAGRPLRRGFTGHHWDAESGMYYAPFRYYMPGAGRWLSRDPLGFVDGPNVYGYVGGNPIMRLDILGLVWWNPFSWRNPFRHGGAAYCMLAGPVGEWPGIRHLSDAIIWLDSTNTGQAFLSITGTVVTLTGGVLVIGGLTATAPAWMLPAGIAGTLAGGAMTYWGLSSTWRDTSTNTPGRNIMYNHVMEVDSAGKPNRQVDTDEACP